MRFKYKGLVDNSEAVDGEIIAESSSEANRLLLEQGIHATSLKSADGFSSSRVRSVLGNNSDTAFFCEQVAAMLNSGMPLSDALKAIANDVAKSDLRNTLNNISTGIESGKPLERMLDENRASLSPVLRQIILAGMASGNLPETLRIAATHFRKYDDIGKKIKYAMVYPSINLVIASIIMFFYATLISPLFRSMFDGMGIELPGITLFLIEFNSIAPFIIVIMIGLVFLFILFLILCRVSDDLFLFRQKIFYMVPMLGVALKNSFIARYARTMELLLSSGVPFARALSLVSVLDKETTLYNGRSIADTVEKGGLYAKALSVQGHAYPKAMQGIISAGESSGRLVEAFGEVAELFTRQADQSGENLAKYLPVILFILVSGFVAINIFAYMLPLIKIMENMGC